MIVGIDARVLSNEFPTGIGTCVIEVLKRFSKCDNDTFYLFSNDNILDQYMFGTNFIKVIVPSESGSRWVRQELSAEIKKYNLDSFWGPLHLLPKDNINIRKVVTINDLALIINPRWGNLRNSILQNTLVRSSIKEADEIISISESTKRDLIRLLNVPENKITICYPAFSINCEEANELALIDNTDIRKVAEQPYLLYVGTIEPRKNIVNIVKAFNLFKKEHRDYKLVIAGKYGWKYKRIVREIQHSDYKDSIIYLGYISDKDKTFLMSNAKMFLFPSYYEGFGIPVAEAIAAGLPVITTDNSSLREVGGNYQFYIQNPNDYNEIYHKMEEIFNLSKDELQRLNIQSMDHIKQFSWDSFAKGIYRALKGTSV